MAIGSVFRDIELARSNCLKNAWETVLWSQSF
jgi:hypothetical protein